MELSARAQNITPSATVELTAKVAEMRKSGIDVIAMNVGEPDFRTPENICSYAKEVIDQGKTKYTAVPGVTELREAICEKLKKENGISYQASEISVGTGAKQSLVNAVLALCGPGDEVLIPTPCWVSYIEMVKLADATPVLVPCREETGFALDLEAIEKAASEKTKAIMINTPNNPTGAVYEKEDLIKLGELAVKYDFCIIADEIYEKLVYDGKEHYSIASYSEEMRQRTVIINGFSKAYAMTGWRLGYAAGPSYIIKGINSIQGHMTSNTCSIAQYAGIEALKGPQQELQDMILAFDERRKYTVSRLQTMDGIQCQTPTGAFYVMPNISAFFGKKHGKWEIRDSFDMAAYLLEEAKIAVVPGAAFEAPQNLRISYSNSMENLEEALNRMEVALAKLA